MHGSPKCSSPHPRRGADVRRKNKERETERSVRLDTPPRRLSQTATLGLRNVLGRGALGALHDVELHRITLGQRLEAVTLDRAVMHEAIFLSIVRGDKAKALRVVEPLHFAGRTHVPLLRKLIV